MDIWCPIISVTLRLERKIMFIKIKIYYLYDNVIKNALTFILLSSWRLYSFTYCYNVPIFMNLNKQDEINIEYLRSKDYIVINDDSGYVQEIIFQNDWKSHFKICHCCIFFFQIHFQLHIWKWNQNLLIFSKVLILNFNI